MGMGMGGPGMMGLGGPGGMGGGDNPGGVPGAGGAGGAPGGGRGMGGPGGGGGGRGGGGGFAGGFGGGGRGGGFGGGGRGGRGGPGGGRGNVAAFGNARRNRQMQYNGNANFTLDNSVWDAQTYSLNGQQVAKPSYAASSASVMFGALSRFPSCSRATTECSPSTTS